ncbi:hypothetical protein GGF41_000308, partial [Coemansia sp. RSA 2531]
QISLPQNVAGFVRKLAIYVSVPDIVSGTAHKQLSEYMGEAKSLPAANKLIIIIVDPAFEYEYLKDSATAKVYEFVQLLESLTPAETLTKVTYTNRFHQLDDFEEEYLGLFSNLLYSRSKQVALSLGVIDLQRMTTIDLIPQVSTLQVCCKTTLDLHTRLVHKCAKTLSDLEIIMSHARGLFYDANDNVVVYPHLQTLKLGSDTVDVPVEQASVPNVVTLPSLKELAIRMPFPFNDDVLFRGNSATLKSLTIPMDNNAVNVIKRTGVLGNQSKDMKVTINQSYHNDALSLVSDDDINLFIGNLVGAAQSLILDNVISVNRFVVSAPLIRGFEQLRELSITKVGLTFFGVISLLKVLPNLMKLGCSFKDLGSELDGISSEELPDHITSTYSRAGKNLQFFSLMSSCGLVQSVVPEYLLLLVLVCPKLCRVELAPEAISDFQTKVNEALGKEPYSKYPSQLNRLLHATY